jgi:integrase
MGHVYKPTIVRYADAEGRRCKKGDSGARKRRVKSKTWRGEYRDGEGNKQNVTLCRNKEAARHMLHELEVKAVRGRAGLVDPFEQHRKRLLIQHLVEFQQYLEFKGNGERHIATTVSRVRTIIDGCGFKLIGDVSANRVAGYLTERRAAGMGISTSNGYLTAVKSFGNWLVKDRRTDENRLAHLSRLNARVDIRRERRPLDPRDFARLIEVAESGKTVCGIRGRNRAMLYLTAGYTGLRASELASLTPASFDFGADPPIVTIEAAYSKHRRKDVLPLHPDLALRLREWLTERDRAQDDEERVVLSIDDSSDGKPVRLWPGSWAANRHAAEMLRHDLQEAAIPYTDDSGKVFDFHAFRHQFISMLAQSGVHPKTAQELARHSSITLTMDHYTHIGLHDLNAALESLPGLPTTESSAMKATGTEGGKNVVAVMVAGVGDISSNSVRAIETGGHCKTDPRVDSGGNQKPLQTQGFESDCDPVSGDENEVREGGLEPPIPVGNQILNLARLPIPPLSL